MAGSYPNAPSRRMAYDDEATVVLVVPGVVGGDVTAGVAPPVAYVEATLTNKEDLNDEDYASVYGGQVNNGNAVWWVTLLFPEKREIDGALFVSSGSGGSGTQSSATSVDTTNGFDGAWIDLGLTLRHNITWVADYYRDNIDSKAISNVLGMMFKAREEDFTFHRVIHVYGTLTPGETPNRLLFLDPDDADAEFSLPLDYGDVPRGQTSTDTLKVKNNSGSETASTISITAEDLFDGSNTWYTYSDDDLSYSASLNLNNLGPGGTQLVYIKQVVPDAQTPGVYAARSKLVVGSWA